MKVKVSQTFKYTLLYILSKPNARTFSDINFTCLFQIAKTKFSQWMNLTISETAAKRSKGHRRLLALVTQGAREARQALTVACDMMAWPSAVHTLRTRLAAAVPVEPRRADCSRQRAEREERKLVDNVGWNKRYMAVKQGMTREIKGVQKKSRPKVLKQKRQRETAKGERKQKSQSLL